MKIKALIDEIRKTPDCHVFAHNGQARFEKDHVMPADLRAFYEMCGGVVLYQSAQYPIYIVEPTRFVLANPVIVGEACEEDISSDWYIIANDGNNEYLTIDLNKERFGRCYDSFYDRHGIIGESMIIAMSFTELVKRLIDNRGEYFYWLKQDFISLGDAYDGV